MTVCTAGCGADVHYKSKRCKNCGAEQTREPKPDAVVADPGQAGQAMTMAFSPDADIEQRTAPLAAIEPKNEAYIVMDDFRMQLGDVNAAFTRNDVLHDFGLIAKLKAVGAPIVPAADVGGMACCPHCKTIFPVGKGAVPLSRSAA
jgi:hypothetical protein